ncbi:class I adenylate-forming enzyme family protein [Agrobacterium vitis]|uniref:class I adenylate-forming enzyme family protein n=1 Tax=Agrobacterium vitis TaxID=373 RepID=UPI0015DB3309|nr:class I adenylate-forming enzyme family protein [Agrobacterium vitis]MCF1455826.1 acyl--CoA ligase [Agrobacterium vitis]BCH56774.1 AMP-dependent ligase [Agrobacterium vitis]
MALHHLFLHHHLSHSAAVRPNKLALQDGTTSITFSNLHGWATAVAHGLHGVGVQPGGRVVLLMENSVEFAKAYWAVVYAGAVVTPVSPQTRTDKLSYIIRDCTPDAVITDAGLVDMVRSASLETPVQILTPASCLELAGAEQSAMGSVGAESLIDQDLGCIIYTSGSTGHPKGVMLSHQNLVTASRSVSTYLGYTEADSIFVAIPLTFDYGMHQLTMGALVGATVVIERNFSKPLYTLDRLARSGATVLPLVPSMIPMIDVLADRFDLKEVRLISSTAAALDPSRIDRLSELFPQAKIYSMYGLTECHRCTYLPPEMLHERKASVGIAIPNTELWVVDADGVRQRRNATGELVIRGATVMKGYWNNPEKTAERLKPGLFPGEYVFHTGDICRLDEHGYVHFVARMDDVLKVKGEKVAPKEVEDALRRHPSVLEAIVFGRPDPAYGQSVCAAVNLRDGANTTPEVLRAWCAEHLEPVAVPRSIEIMEAFKLTMNGKIDRTQFYKAAV